MLQIRAIILFFFLSLSGYSQSSCDLIFTGTVIDNHDDKPLIGAVVKLGDQTAVTNNDGVFVISELCTNEYELVISHIACENLHQQLQINSSSNRTFYLEHHAEYLEDVEVEEIRKRGEVSKAITTITGDEFADQQGKQFADLLANVEGVTLLQTGTTISKPVINGLHSQRILMINNGMRMEGQQWGLEHAPEVDPFSVQTLSVIQGAGSVEYGADGIGGVILVEPADLPDSYGTSFSPSLAFFSNGRGGKASLNILGKERVFGLPLSFQAQGSIGKTGNLNAPDYYLDNTGTKENNFMLRAGYVGDDFGVELKMSQYNNELGLLTDSHIGNQTALEAIIENGEPFVDRGFSYDIGRPRQDILHEITQAKGYWNTSLGQVGFNLTRQYNSRSEFDRFDDRPGLRLKTETYTEQIDLQHQFTENWNGKIGAQFQQQDYRYNGFYLIPENQLRSIGAFVFERFFISDAFTLEGGFRYDQKDYTYDIEFDQIRNEDKDFLLEGRELEGEFLEVNTNFNDLITGSFGVQYSPSEAFTSSLYYGHGRRQPLPNELFSNGVHHGTALWEEGDASLTTEQANNLQLNLGYEVEKTKANLTLYRNQVSDFIYNVPKQPLEFKFTIRGRFPVWEQVQSDATFFGFNSSIQHSFLNDRLFASTKASFLWADNTENDQPLFLMPSNRLQHQAKFQINPKLKLGASLQNVFEQTRFPDPAILEDFAPPPPGYSLLDLQVDYTTKLLNSPIRLIGGIENITNTEYKDYLDRFRYFAHAPGVNYGIRVQYTIN